MKPILPVAFLFLSAVSAAAQNANVAVMSTPVPANTTLKARVYYEQSGRPVKRTSVMLVSDGDGPRESSGLTDANGMLVIKKLRAGKYYAIVNAPGAVSPLAYVDIRKPRSDGIAEDLKGQPAIFVNGISDLETEIPVKIGGAIGGRVSYADGSPAIGVRVEVLRKVEEEFLPTLPNFSALSAMMMGGAGSFQTDDRGQYRFAGLPEGQYVVKVTEAVNHQTRGDVPRYGMDSLLFGGSSSMVNVFFENAFDKESAQLLQLAFGQELSEVNLTIPDRSLRKIEGKVVAAKDKYPIRNVRLTISREGDQEFTEYSPARNPLTTTTDDEGKFEFVELPPGKYKIALSPTNSDFNEKDKAYGGRSSSDIAAAANSANATANYGYDESGYNWAGNMNARSGKPPSPKFANENFEFAIEENDLTEQIVELNYGARVSGTVTVESEDGKLNSVSIIAFDEDGKNHTSESVGFYEYGEEGERSRPKTKEFTIEGVAAGKPFIGVHPDSDDFYVKSATAGALDLLQSPLDLKEAGVVTNVKIVIANDVGMLECKIVDAEGGPLSGFELVFVPTDQAKNRTGAYFKHAKSDANGEVKLKLAPMEYAAVSFPKVRDKKSRAETFAWLSEAVKKAQKFTVEAGKTAKGTVKAARDSGK